MKSLYERLKEYSETNCYAFHMPGHKRRKVVEAGLPYEIDLTEVGDFDDLHHASGILKEAMERAANVYHAKETQFLINGSTVGILSAIMGNTEKGDKILVARNAHKSVYHAILMQELEPVYLYPEHHGGVQINGELLPETVEAKLQEHADIKAVVIVSPTYDGVVSDVAKIAKISHARGIPLIVDEAHGAHFGFHPYFPQNANQAGADIVIHSIHKTLPSLTQTALLHMNGTLVNRENVRRYLQMLQSSSPSYVLLASIDACVGFLENEGAKAFEEYVKQLQAVRAQLRELKNLQLLETPCYDCSKIVIAVNHTDINGKMLYRRLEKEFSLQLEMAAGTYVVAMTSLADTKEGYERLVCALKKVDVSLSGTEAVGNIKELSDKETAGNIDKLSDKETVENIGGLLKKETTGNIGKLQKKEPARNIENLSDKETKKETTKNITKLPQAEHVKSHGSKRKSFKRKDSIGKVSAEMAYLYPPGIPLIAEGERISKEVILYLEKHEEMGFEIEGCRTKGRIEVWIDG